ncbi:hypothetical protein [Paenibacillus allorhizoplanae]|uniref:hypothetical protein n=1 Tax=Paenibacillus allorhizoplanae TaxID=2905648 RepID=UPI001F2C6193|nr:hypothetical protein [Paenibacillus allorhizoplanae]
MKQSSIHLPIAERVGLVLVFSFSLIAEYNNDYTVFDDDYNAAKTLGMTGFAHSNETRAGMTMDGNGACSL